MAKAYIIYSVAKPYFKEALKKTKWANDKRTWENIVYEVPTQILYVIKDRDAAIRDARNWNRGDHKFTVHFIIETEIYEN